MQASQNSAPVHVFHEGNQIGPFPIDTVREMMQLGSLNSSASVWQDGMADWQPIEQFLAANPPSAVGAPAMKPEVRMRAGPDFAGIAAAKASSEPSDISRILRSLMAGGLAALVAGGAWLALALGLHVQIGWLAWGVGALCGWSVAHFGRGNGVVFQIIAVGFSLLGIAIGKVGIVLGGYWPFSLFDILWIILAVASAWKTAGGGDQ